MAKYDYLNDYLNSNMNTYKGGGLLTSYNAGGKHEENIHGGIPLGDDALVEQGETSINVGPEGVPQEKPTGAKYIFSDRQMWTPEEIKAAGLPSIKSKEPISAASYTKKLFDKAKGREGDSASKETLKAFTQRAQQLAETKRMAEEAAVNQAMAANAKQVAPENTEVPQGMEEYVGQMQEQMPQEAPMQMGPQDVMMAAQGGYFTRRKYFTGGYDPASTGTYSTMFGAVPNYQVSSSSTGEALDKFGNVTKEGMDPKLGTGDIADKGAGQNYGKEVGNYMAAATTGYDLFNMAKTGSTSRDAGTAMATGALKGAAAGASFGPWGAAIGGVVGAGAGFIGSKKAEKNFWRETNKAIESANAGMPNSSAWTGVAAQGGYITSKPASYAGGGIHIKPENRGLLHKNLGVPQGEKIPVSKLQIHEGDSEALRKRKQFAINARSWHANGGPIENPYAGIPSILQNQDPGGMMANSATPIIPMVGSTIPSAPINKFPKPGIPTSWPNKPSTLQEIQQYQTDRGIAKKGDKGFGTFGPKTTAAWALDEQANQLPVVPQMDNPRYIAQQGIQAEKDAQLLALHNQYQAQDVANAAKAKADAAKPTFGQKAREFGDKYASDVMRAYPILSNIEQRGALTKPTGTYYARLSDAYNVPVPDEARAMRDVNAAYANRVRAIGQMGGSQAQQRAALLGLGAQQNQAIGQVQQGLSEAQMNRAMQEQQFKSAIAQYNANAMDRSTEAYRMDLGNYETQKSKLTGQIGTDIGLVGKEQTNMKQVAAMYGYTWDGKYMRNPKTGAIVTIPVPAATTATTPPTTAVVKYGGFIMNKKGKC